MGVPQELGSAYLEITTKGLDKAKQDLAVLKSNLLDSAKGQDQFNSKLLETGKVAVGTQSTLRGLVDSVGRWLGFKVPEKQVSIKADGLDQIEEGLTKLKKQAVGVKLDTRATEAPQPVHVSVIADKVHVAQPEPVKVSVEAATPFKPAVEQPEPIKVPVEPIKPTVEPPKPVTVAFLEKGIAEIQSALAALKSPTLTVQAREEGIAKIQASLDALKPHAVDVPLLASGLADIQRGIDAIKANPFNIRLPAVTPVAIGPLNNVCAFCHRPVFPWAVSSVPVGCGSIPSVGRTERATATVPPSQQEADHSMPATLPVVDTSSRSGNLQTPRRLNSSPRPPLRQLPHVRIAKHHAPPPTHSPPPTPWQTQTTPHAVGPVLALRSAAIGLKTESVFRWSNGRGIVRRFGLPSLRQANWLARQWCGRRHASFATAVTRYAAARGLHHFPSR